MIKVCWKKRDNGGPERERERLLNEVRPPEAPKKDKRFILVPTQTDAIRIAGIKLSAGYQKVIIQVK